MSNAGTTSARRRTEGGALTGTSRGAGATRGRTPTQLALAETIRENAAEAAAEVETTPAAIERWDEDDYRDDDHTPDLGAPVDDEPYREEPDEHLPILPIHPEIVFRRHRDQVRWDVRLTTAAILEDRALVAEAIDREADLHRYAEMLAADFLTPGLLAADLITIWDALPLRNPHNAFDTARWNTQTAIAERARFDTSVFSRDRALLVGLPSGKIVPLQFFSWKTENDPVVAAIADSPELFTASIAKIAEKTFPQPRVQRTAKDLIPWVRAVVAHRGVVHRYRSLFRSFPSRFEETLPRFRDDLTAAESERARHEGRPIPALQQDRPMPVLHRALVGGIR